MAKKIFGIIVPLLLVFSIVMSTTAFAATTYYIDVTLTGPDKDGVTQTVRGNSSIYGSINSPLAYEVVNVINSKLSTLEEVFAWTGLRANVDEGLEAFAEGEEAWYAYCAAYENKSVQEDFQYVLRDLDSTFADLTVDEENELSFISNYGTVYYVTITLREHTTGTGDIETPETAPIETDPIETDPIETDPIETDPIETDPVETDPIETEPVVIDPIETEPVVIDPIETEPAETDEPAGISFTDTDVAAWYYDAVAYCVENGLMDGYSDTLFGPDDILTRAHIVQILYNLEGRPEVTYRDHFDDVDESEWYADAIAWAANLEIALGYGDGNFGPNDYVTREQLAAFLFRYSEYKGHDVSSHEDIDELPHDDAHHVSDWAEIKMKWAHAEGIILGMSEDILAPLGQATRAQAATMLMRFHLNVAN